MLKAVFQNIEEGGRGWGWEGVILNKPLLKGLVQRGINTTSLTGDKIFRWEQISMLVKSGEEENCLL